MNNIQIFNNPILGDLRTVIVNGKEYFFWSRYSFDAYV